MLIRGTARTYVVLRNVHSGGEHLNIDNDQIEEAKAKLGDRTADLIAEILNVDKYDARNHKGCCPFHDEKTPSFIYNSKTFKYHCFGCNKSVDIIDAYMSRGETFTEAVSKVFELADMPFSMGEHKVRTKLSYRYPKLVENVDKSKVYEYAAKRGLSNETINYCDVRQDEHGNAVFNYYDTNDVLTLVKYRPARRIDKSKGEIKCWCQKGADTTPLLFNMNRINTTSPLLICEGEWDCMSAIEAGFTNTVSVPLGAGNFGWIEENWDWLEQFESIIICSDSDEAGKKMQKECIYRLGTWRCKTVQIPPIIEHNGKQIKVKDLNEVLYYCGKEKVMQIITEATDTPIDSVSDYSDIKNIDLDAIDGIKTGFYELDKRLMKLFFSTFNILTGVNGSGKSSFISQLVCQAAEQGYNTWYFSGELPNFQCKNWLNYIFAGQRNITQENYGDTDFWRVNKSAQREMDKFYKEHIFIYKDGKSHKVNDLLESMVECIRKYGAKLCIVDNLTAVNLECNENNKYQKQEEFVTKCIDIAKKYNVVIIMVVHPHKIETMRRLSKMDVQGISAIIDLAHRIISLYRVTEEDKRGRPKNNGKGWYKEPIKYDVLCDVLKDRMMGFEGSTVGLYYDRPSRRFFANERDLAFNYAWDKRVYSSKLPFPPKQLRSDIREVFGEVNNSA